MNRSIPSFLLVFLAASANVATAALPTVGGCTVFPADNYWNTPIDTLPLHPSSATWVASVGTASKLHADWGNVLSDNYGIPFITVPGTQPLVPINPDPVADYSSESDPGPYPVPPNAPIEGGPLSTGDRHVLVIETTNCVLYELYNATPINGGTSWTASSYARWPLNSNALRPADWTSADAAGLAIFPGLVRWEEVQAGEIAHAIRFTAVNIWGKDAATGNLKYLWPARHNSGVKTNTAFPPMGARFRLKASFDISTFSAPTQVILRAFKKYGMVLADGGSNWFFQGVSDTNWPDAVFSELGSIAGSNFEVVDTSVLQIDPNSAKSLQPQSALAITKSGTGTGTVTSVPAGINCGSTCTAGFNTGSAVTLNAAASAGSVFSGWGGACAGTAACALTMDVAKSASATFNLITSPATISANPATLDFGGQSINTTSPSLAMTLTNTGGASLAVASVATSAYYAVSHNCGTLAPGTTCTANVTFTPAAQGTLPGTLTVATAGGSSQSFGLTGLGEMSLVTHYYRSILRRAPDSGGKAFWEGEATRMQSIGVNVNETWYAMAGSFYTSPEYLAFNRDNNGFVTDLYNTFFNRPPDGAGLAFWAGQIASGMPREVALVSFMFSTEFVNFTQAIFGNTVVRKEIDTVVDFYRGILGRLPDTTGFNFWVAQFRAAQCAGAASVTAQAESISSQFALSGEYAARARSNAQYVGDLYNAFLRRGGDLAGVQFWISQLATSAQTREQVRKQFVASPEFSSRVAAVIAQGCLP